MGALITTVHVPDDEGGYTVFGPDDELPEWAARRIGAHAFEDGEHPFSDDADGDGVADRQPGVEPPRNGKGSGLDSWVAFAHEKGVTDVDTSMKRDDVVQLLVDRGVISAA